MDDWPGDFPIRREKALLEAQHLDAVRGRKDTTDLLKDKKLSPKQRAELRLLQAEFLEREMKALKALNELKARLARGAAVVPEGPEDEDVR
jgi:hypothetical protein